MISEFHFFLVFSFSSSFVFPRLTQISNTPCANAIVRLPASPFFHYNETLLFRTPVQVVVSNLRGIFQNVKTIPPLLTSKAFHNLPPQTCRFQLVYHLSECDSNSATSNFPCLSHSSSTVHLRCRPRRTQSRATGSSISFSSSAGHRRSTMRDDAPELMHRTVPHCVPSQRLGLWRHQESNECYDMSTLLGVLVHTLLLDNAISQSE